ncbi:hypothetical protein PpBr36_08281 [Pyricularia pennisetigena]|uniref:hypothetical protein n=1 Tax=Pyricularia pennisetigena TaxID=1578925 RepID=UPI001153C2BC|nr:hypothetical protein PpBr36_08281 [Pyricularia pennisetigena]TLS24018.1 hypothetical protein PpBr36_08281 [Pyricularia pennisetigena]
MSPAACPRCTHTLIIPPSASSIKAEWPDVEPDGKLDRSAARCYQCELAQAILEYNIALYHGGHKATFEAIQPYFAIWGKRDHTNTLTNVSRS